MKKSFFFLFALIGVAADAQPPADTTRRRLAPPPVGTVTPTRQTPVHDPVMIRQGDAFYLFCTGNGIQVFSSTDLNAWRREAPVFSRPPAWIQKALPQFRGSSLWAPDISYHNGLYYLYYAASVFGKNTSVIGVAVNKTLDSASADFRWEDRGLVLQSVPGRDLWNAIDPNLIVDDENTPWLSFGSFWEGIKLVKLNADLTRPAEPQEWYTVARRPRTFGTADSLAGNAAIEAPYLFKKGPYYYLFVSWDYCCRGEKSDYKVVVGRSRNIRGPYLDKAGVDLARNGGTPVVQGDGVEWFGVGHNAVYNVQGKDYVIYHGYDAADRGRSKLQLGELGWEDGWPVVLQSGREKK